MSTSWSADGTKSKFCSKQGPDDDPDGYQQNCFAGGQFFDDDSADGDSVWPTVTIGVADFAMEWWMKTTMFSAASGEDFSSITGLFDTNIYATYGINASMWQRHGAFNPWIDFNWGTGSAQSRPVASPVVGWQHNLANFDRNGNLTWYKNGEIYDAVSIAGSNGVDIGDLYVAPLHHEAGLGGEPGIVTDPGGTYPDSLTDPFSIFNFSHHSYYIGPFALHVGALLSATQINNSLRNRCAQNIAGVTQVYYNWRRILYVTGWEKNRRHINRQTSDYIKNLAAPLSDQTTVVVVDETQNGNDLELDVTDEYGQELWDRIPWVFAPGDRATCAFVSDSFFQSGGGIRGQGL